MADQVIVEFRADIADLQSDINKIKSQLSDVNKEGANVGTGISSGVTQGQKALGGFSTSLKGIGNTIKSVAGPLLAAFAIQDIVRTAVSSVKDFEVSLDRLSSITGLDQTSEGFQSLKQGAIDLASQSSLTANDVAQAFAKIGSARPELLKDAEALQEVTKASITLSEAGVIGLDDASKALTGTLAQFGLGAEDSQRVINALAAGSQAGAAGISEVADTIRVSGTALAANNVTVEEAIALTETLAEKQITGAEAGTSLRNVVSRLSNAGLGFVDGQFNVNAALDEAREKFDAIEDPAKRGQEITKLFGLESAAAGRILLDNTDAFNEYTKAVTDTNTANEQAAINTDNLETSIARLQSAYNDVFLSLSSGEGVIADVAKAFIDVLLFAIDLVKEGFSQVSEIYQDVSDIFGEAIAVFEEVGEMLGLVGDDVQSNITLMDIFSKAIEALLVPVKFVVEGFRFFVSNLRTVTDAVKQFREEGVTLQGFLNLFRELIQNVAVRFARFGRILAELFNFDTTKLDEFISKNDNLKKTVEETTKTTEDATKATKDLTDQTEALGNTSEISAGKVVTLSEALRKEQQEILKILENQALTGQIDEALVERLRQINLQQDAAKALLEDALSGPEIAPTGDIDLGELGLDLDLTPIVKDVEFEEDLDFELPEPDAVQVDIEAGNLDKFIADQKAAQEAARAAQEEINAQLISSGLEVADALFDIQQQRREEELISIDNNLQQQQDLLQRSLDNGEISQTQFEERKRRLEEETDRKRREILRKQAIADKQKALFDIAIATSIAIAKGLATPAVPPFPSAIAAGIAGAVQAALVAAQPIPQFAEGGLIGGKLHKDGGTIIEAEKGEFIAKRKAVKAYLPELQAINNGNFDQLIYKDYVLPALKEAIQKDKEASSESIGKAIANNIVNNNFSDLNLLESDKKNRFLLSQINENLKRLRGTDPITR